MAMSKGFFTKRWLGPPRAPGTLEIAARGLRGKRTRIELASQAPAVKGWVNETPIVAGALRPLEDGDRISFVHQNGVLTYLYFQAKIPDNLEKYLPKPKDVLDDDEIVIEF